MEWVKQMEGWTYGSGMDVGNWNKTMVVVPEIVMAGNRVEEVEAA
jgi:hypothetical protein